MSININLTRAEKSIVDSLTQLDDGNWRCDACDGELETVIAAVIHIYEKCPSSDTAGPNASAPISMVVNVCAYLDPVGCTPMLESYRRVQAEEPEAEESPEQYQNYVWAEYTGPSQRFESSGQQDVPMTGVLAETPEEQLSQMEAEDEDDLDPNVQHVFPATPPDSLNETDKRKWRRYQLRKSTSNPHIDIQPY